MLSVFLVAWRILSDAQRALLDALRTLSDAQKATLDSHRNNVIIDSLKSSSLSQSPKALKDLVKIVRPA